MTETESPSWTPGRTNEPPSPTSSSNSGSSPVSSRLFASPNSRGQYSLKWNGFEDEICNGFAHLYCSEDLADVTLGCEGKLFKGHKIILAMCSSFFRKIFMDVPCEHPVVIIKGMKPSDLQHVIQYMYFGEVRLLQDEIDDFIEAAESLKIEGLTFFEKDSAIHYARSGRLEPNVKPLDGEPNSNSNSNNTNNNLSKETTPATAPSGEEESVTITQPANADELTVSTSSTNETAHNKTSLNATTTGAVKEYPTRFKKYKYESQHSPLVEHEDSSTVQTNAPESPTADDSISRKGSLELDSGNEESNSSHLTTEGTKGKFKHLFNTFRGEPYTAETAVNAYFARTYAAGHDDLDRKKALSDSEATDMERHENSDEKEHPLCLTPGSRSAPPDTYDPNWKPNNLLFQRKTSEPSQPTNSAAQYYHNLPKTFNSPFQSESYSSTLLASRIPLEGKEPKPTLLKAKAAAAAAASTTHSINPPTTSHPGVTPRPPYLQDEVINLSSSTTSASSQCNNDVIEEMDSSSMDPQQTSTLMALRAKIACGEFPYNNYRYHRHNHHHHHRSHNSRLMMTPHTITSSSSSSMRRHSGGYESTHHLGIPASPTDDENNSGDKDHHHHRYSGLMRNSSSPSSNNHSSSFLLGGAKPKTKAIRSSQVPPSARYTAHQVDQMVDQVQHFPGNLVPCAVCQKFVKRERLRAHIHECHLLHGERIICPHCGIGLKSKGSFRVHIWRHKRGTLSSRPRH